MWPRLQYDTVTAIIGNTAGIINATGVATGEALPNKTAWRREAVLVPGWKGLFPGKRSGIKLIED